ncbi:hypothetical protein LGZ99_09835 [Photorhabdus temperata]|uniref:N-acetyltransferase domain-containing protein n=2 Tax=Photorhabdus temperata TaxID=574560 RepID=A0A081RWY2_PHOTE|nr:hypothetical protein [Photorhabdus temperata]EQC00956.1 hypothetical protein B738_08481 [Photorhabdus temperata subsp. temperata M1021]ERT13240.1 hypothetical protein O185_09805 [Photorhabdus temperata J3]KER03185.1 hypothetical protein MEG1DRAFT_02197 [Photorhabdus temperata subsp. temperata Meg1]MCT8347503.1 hypothetical protein [Photorhabdus temperata]
MLSLKHVAQLTYNILQLYMNQRGIDLVVGPISDNDANMLTRAYGDINWEYYITEVGNRDNCFSLCIKFVKSREPFQVESVPAGAALSTYDLNDKSFNIYVLENFVKDTENHPLRRKMLLYTLYTALIFMNMVDGEIVRIHEPVEDKIAYYCSFGFELERCGYVMSCDIQTLIEKVKSRSESLAL